MPKPLTTTQKELLGLLARSGDVEAGVTDDHTAAYRQLRLDGWQGDATGIKQRVTRLCQRPDAALILRAHRERRGAIVRQDLLKADHAVGQTIISAEEMQQDALNAIYDLALTETQRFRDDTSGRRSARAAVDAWDKVRKATAAEGSTVGLTEEEALVMIERKLSQRQQQTHDGALVEKIDKGNPVGRA